MDNTKETLKDTNSNQVDCKLETNSSGPNNTSNTSTSKKFKRKPKPFNKTSDSSTKRNDATETSELITNDRKTEKPERTERNLSKRLQEYQKKVRPEFSCPDEQVSSNKKTEHSNSHENKDLRTKLTLKLSDSSYECMVCWESVRHKHHTWSCKSCWAVFHLNCIKKWSSSLKEGSSREVKLFNGQQLWRCPGCQSTQEELPSKYLCFCGKVSAPEFNSYATPHSCSQMCGKKRKNDCPHPCVEPCHPGPCPPCTALAPPESCFCGQVSIQARCGSVKNIQSCGKTCGELLGCTRHFCEEPCHEGTCPPCQLEERQTCYCGESSRISFCGAGREEVSWIAQQRSEKRDCKVYIIGHFSCTQICPQTFDCNVHTCSKVCHPIDEVPSVCNLSPSKLVTCPCGKTPLSNLDSAPRNSCTDPIPLCGKVCGKYYQNCHHQCNELCHEGDCPPCAQKSTISCRCKSSSQPVVCFEVGEIVCTKQCNTLKSCLKHRCDQICCPAKGDKIDEDGFHICTKVCKKKLNCGIHFCTQLCHSGKCSPCLEASFEDMTCFCGKTVKQAPIPCGTKPPSCSFQCPRPRECGHTTGLTHECHFDNVSCPPCTALTTKLCLCGKKHVKNIPCYRNTPSCGIVCNKQLSCGAHPCKKTCHQGPCLDTNENCTAQCAKSLPGCGHPCRLTCHAPSMCPPEPGCQELIQLPCVCGRRTFDRICNGQPLSQRSPAPCDSECQILIRNLRLQEALGIDSAPVINQSDLYDPYIFVFINPTQLKWVKAIESKIHDFVLDKNKPVLRFNPMQSYQRKFLHCIAANYQVDSISVDEPPNKSVDYIRTASTKLPSVVPSEAYKHPEKYSKPDEDEAKEIKPSRQPVNMVLIRNMDLGATISLSFQENLLKIGLQADVFAVGSNVVVKPVLSQNQAIDQLDDILKKCLTVVKSVLNSSHMITKPILGWVNESGEIIWPKLDGASSKSANASKSSFMNKFAILNEFSDEDPKHSKKLVFKKIIQPTEAEINQKNIENAPATNNLPTEGP